MFFKDFKTFKTTLADRPLEVEVGKMAQLAGGSCLIRYGETEVLCTATMADKPREGVDFFPLSVDFEEKLYSVGRIPGSFQRREGRASEKATLASRVIDRPIRPLFPKDMRNDVSVVMTVLAVDPDNSPHGVKSFFVINGKREKVDALSGLNACGNVCHYHCFAVFYPAGTV